MAKEKAKAAEEQQDPLEGKTVVVMLQSMAGERLSYIPGDQVAVKDEVALAWEEAGIARLRGKDDLILPPERIKIHPEA